MKIHRHTVALGGGRFLPGFAVIEDDKLVEWFRQWPDAKRFVEQQKEEAERDG